MRGQAAVVITMCIVLLIIILGLAIDGGSIYNQRRIAQNSADAAALAGTREMLTGYDAMIQRSSYDIDGDEDLDTAINLTITNFANLHGIDRANLEAYYVNDSKQIVSDVQVGQLHRVPWASAGAKGITIRNRAETGSFFMKMFGWDKIGARASSTAFMGIAVDSGTGVPLMPVGLFTDTEHLANFTIGSTYTLIEGDIYQSSGNWGWVDFNGKGGSADITDALLDCGFNPPIVTDDQWDQWCPTQLGEYHAEGPTQHFQCADHPDCRTPVADPIFVPYLKWGPGDQGWWVASSSGTARSNCHDLQGYIVDGKHYVVPVIDEVVGGGGGNNTLYHVLALAKFLLTNTDVTCNGNPDTPTPPPAPTPTATPAPNDHWHIEGTFEGLYVAGASGRSGDLRHTSLRTVYLDN
jgi:Putative Flp pilus-assembly TadE/G-like